MRINTSYLIALIFVAANNGFVRLAESASIRLTKQCFSIGETITIRFINVEGEGIFVGLYPDADVPNREILPGLDSPSLIKWVLTCGRLDGCDDWSTRGLVQLSTDGLQEDDYIIALSGNHSGLSPQAMTRNFHVGDCSGFFSVPEASPMNNPIMQGPTQTTVVASLPETTVASLPKMPTPQPVPILEPVQVTPTPQPVPVPVPVQLAPESVPVQVASESVLVVSDAINSVIDDARTQIENLIRDDGDLTGKFLRLTFHDCIGGCNGCVDMANPDNAGLDKPVSALEPIANDFLDRGLTRTDIWMLAGLVATETAIPPDDRDILFDLQWVGRKTCEQMVDCGVDFGGNPTVCTPMRGPNVRQAHASFGTRSIQSFFETEFKFSPQQVTALMGAHSVGRMSRENSGFSGRWDLSSTTFDGGYWIELIGQPPEFFVEDVINDDLPGIPNRRQWGGIVSANSRVTMLHTDIALVRNLEDMKDGIANCDFNGPGACSQDTPFMPHARRYNEDNRSWLFDFRDVFNILIDHGHEKVGECPSGRICTFGFESQNTLSTEAIERPPIESPSSDSSPFIPDEGEGGGGATIFLDKQCYNSGDTIVVNFFNVSGENIWIGILPLDAVPDLRDLPAGPDSQSDLLKEWILSCGHSSCHTWLSEGGFQLPTDQLEEDEYAIVVSGDGGSLVGQAVTAFSFGRC